MLNLILRMNKSFLMKWSPARQLRDFLPRSPNPLAHIWSSCQLLAGLPSTCQLTPQSITSLLLPSPPCLPKFLLSPPWTSPAPHWGQQRAADGKWAAFQSWLAADTHSPILKGPSAKAWFYLPLVDSFPTSHCCFLIDTVFLHASADDLDSAFYWHSQGHSKPTAYKALTRNSWNCLAFIPTNHLVWL